MPTQPVRTIIVAPNVGRVSGLGVDAIHLSDRVANDEAFAGEYIARIPRSLARRWQRAHFTGSYLLGRVLKREVSI